MGRLFGIESKRVIKDKILKRELRKKAKFITVEGLEGCGKSSVIKFLSAYLRKRGFSVGVFREPGSTPIGEKIRILLLDKRNKEMSKYTELLLYLAARAQLIEEKLKDALNTYDFVICDRFSDSTLVYQGYALGLEDIAKRCVEMFSFGLVPELTFVLDLPVKKALSRIKKKDRIEERSWSFHQRLRQGYKKLVRKFPQRVILIDADKELKDLYKKIEEILIEKVL